jgi:hypothetical protein
VEAAPEAALADQALEVSSICAHLETRFLQRLPRAQANNCKGKTGSSGSSTGSGSTSGSSNAGGRSAGGSGTRPGYGSGGYYGGGASVPYAAGQRTPRGLAAAGLIPLAGLAFLGTAWAASYAYGAYLYPYGSPVSQETSNTIPNCHC